MGIKPLKKFGQNYLIDKNIVNKMILPLELKPNDAVLEIGPGKGFITEILLENLDKLTAVEIDTRVIKKLIEKFPNVDLIQGDFLNIRISELGFTEKIKIIGNIPFNLTGSILFKLLEEKDFVNEAVFIIPLDIAKRLVAVKQTKEYGILTIIFSYFSCVKIITKVSPNVFFPKPNMESAIIHIKFNKLEKENIDNKLFIKTVKAAFGNRRKTLNNSLRNSIFRDYDFSKVSLDLSKRAEEFDLNDFLELTEYLQNQVCKKKTN